MNEAHDYIRELAKKHIGKDYTDKEWTKQVRDYWKRFFHAKNYGSIGNG